MVSARATLVTSFWAAAAPIATDTNVESPPAAIANAPAIASTLTSELSTVWTTRFPPLATALPVTRASALLLTVLPAPAPAPDPAKPPDAKLPDPAMTKASTVESFSAVTATFPAALTVELSMTAVALLATSLNAPDIPTDTAAVLPS